MIICFDISAFIFIFINHVDAVVDGKTAQKYHCRKATRPEFYTTEMESKEHASQRYWNEHNYYQSFIKTLKKYGAYEENNYYHKSDKPILCTVVFVTAICLGDASEAYRELGIEPFCDAFDVFTSVSV